MDSHSLGVPLHHSIADIFKSLQKYISFLTLSSIPLKYNY